MNKLISLIIVFLLGVHLTSCQLNGTELDSIIWIIQQLGFPNIPLDSTMCSGYPTYITCTPDNNHIKTINSPPFTFVDRGSPSPTLTEFNFPEATDMVLTAQAYIVKDPSLVILERVRNLPKLVNLWIQGDPALVEVPTDFPFGIPLLKQVKLTYLANCTSIPSQFSQGDKIESLLLTGPKLGDISIFKRNSFLPNLTMATIEMAPTAIHTFVFNQTSFPKLTTLSILLTSNMLLNVDVESTMLSSISLSNRNNLNAGGYNLNVADSSKITSLGVIGNLSSINPSSLDAYPNLENVGLAFGLTSYPMSYYPINATKFALTYTDITTLPNIPIPSKVTTYSFAYSPATQFPQTIFDNLVGATVDFSNNAQITGSVPTSLCRNTLRLYGTPVSYIPDCLWCYLNDGGVMTYSPLPNGFSCPITLDSTTLYLIQGKADITGTNIGFGNSGSGYTLSTIIPNQKLLYSTSTSPPDYVPKIYEISLSSKNIYLYNITVMEVGILVLNSGNPVQSAYNVAFLFSSIFYFNPNIPHNVTLVGESLNNQSPIHCKITLNNTNTIQCSTLQGIRSDNYTITFNNAYTSYVVPGPKVKFVQQYPTLTTISYPNIVSAGSQITINGVFGSSSNPSLVMFNNVTNCTVVSKTYNQLRCNLSSVPAQGPANISITIDGFIAERSNALTFITAKEECDTLTYFCNGHGYCNDSGICICDPGFYQNCSLMYPIVNSYKLDNITNTFSFIGDFGPYNQSNPSVTIAGQNCSIISINQTQIYCVLDPLPSVTGFVMLHVRVDEVMFGSDRIIFFEPNNTSTTTGIDTTGPTTGPTTTDSPTTITTTTTTSNNGEDTPQEICERVTYNCYGHGRCNIQGQCECDQNYNIDDNCRTEFTNTTIIPNTTNPTVSFNVSGMTFDMEIYSIQELDMNDKVVKELFINFNKWNVNLTSDNITTIVNYQLNITNYNVTNGEPEGFNPYFGVNVSSVISFSSIPRDIPFADKSIHINPYSIKLSVSINDWIYASNLDTLQVVFKSTIINNQTTSFDCDEISIDTFQYNQVSDTIQYLRVVKDNVQFNGRFIDYALTDNKTAFSQTKLLSLTPFNESNLESIAMIGIGFPQCRECMLDPDFTPLLIDKGSDEGCGNNDSKTWRIVVGVVVGGVGLIAIAVGTTLLIKKNITKRNYNRNLSNKLNQFKA